VSGGERCGVRTLALAWYRLQWKPVDGAAKTRAKLTHLREISHGPRLRI
jgi:hypothetical protein